MCGFSGFVSHKMMTQDQMQTILRQMSAALQHRGPDDQGIWLDNNHAVGLAHQRLSIQDLSQQGHQPMQSASERYVIAYNGEIYNGAEIKAQLSLNETYWRGHSDTEIMLAAIETWGIEKALKRFNGMFAFALWDRQHKQLILARDRLGIKPLYYGWVDGQLVFASELTAIKQFPCFKADISRDALAQYIQYGYVPTPLSIYHDVYKLPQGSFLVATVNDQINLTEEKYWQAKDYLLRPRVTLSRQEAVDHLENLLLDSVQSRMVSDVPLGAFLSGGVDSSTVVALMQKQHSNPIKTFSIGFEEGDYNEAHYAKKIAEHLATDHTELYISANDALTVIPTLSQHIDEPIADPSVLPTYLVSKLAKQSVTVSLSGDGGDELFGGYVRYQWLNDYWKKTGWLPGPAKQLLGKMMMQLSPEQINTIFRKARAVLPNRYHYAQPGEKIHKLARALSAKTPDSFYFQLISKCHDVNSMLVNYDEPQPEVFNEVATAHYVDRIMYYDLMGYLPDDILTKVDRASMAVSLEARVPLLDHRVVEFALSLPLTMKLHQRQSKWLLRQVLYKHVPKALIERPKMGFTVPLRSWLAGPLREWADDLLGEQRLRTEGHFVAEAVRDKWQTFLSAHSSNHRELWHIVMFQAWLQQQRQGV